MCSTERNTFDSFISYIFLLNLPRWVLFIHVRSIVYKGSKFQWRLAELLLNRIVLMVIIFLFFYFYQFLCLPIWFKINILSIKSGTFGLSYSPVSELPLFISIWTIIDRIFIYINDSINENVSLYDIPQANTINLCLII